MTGKYNRPREPEPSYTHALHVQACQEAAKSHQVLVQHVLARKGQLVYFGIIKAPYTVPGGPDCWTLETSWPEKARLTVVCKNVIACDPVFCSCRPAPVSEPVFEVTCL
jgi:hypothetical protein